jgi:hypothetical protein
VEKMHLKAVFLERYVNVIQDRLAGPNGPHGGKLTALACHPTKRVNKAEELTYLSTNIA